MLMAANTSAFHFDGIPFSGEHYYGLCFLKPEGTDEGRSLPARLRA